MWDAIRDAVRALTEGDAKPAWMLVLAALGYLTIRLLAKFAGNVGTVAGGVWTRYDKLLSAYERAVEVAKADAALARAEAKEAREMAVRALKEREEIARELANAEALILELREGRHGTG